MVMLAWQDDSANPFQNILWMPTNPDQQRVVNWNNKRGALLLIFLLTS